MKPSRKLKRLIYETDPFSQGEVTDKLVGRWYKVADDGSLDRGVFWMFSPNGGVKNTITLEGSPISFEGEFKVMTSMTGSAAPELFLKFSGATNFTWYADIDVAGDSLSMNTTHLRGYEDNFARVR